jgi:beta-glucanase (GH16 family)
VGLSVGESIYAKGVAKVYGIDPLTGGSIFKYGFRYMDSSNIPVAPDDVVTINSSTSSNDRWVPLVVNGTVPEGTARVQLIVEFTQNSSTDTGAVYLDDLSVGMGEILSSQNIGGSTYNLVWSDEFDGSTLNAANWTPEVGRGPNNDGWGNNEAQTYTTNSSNLRVEGGSLIMEAIKSGSSWTSARIKSQDKRSFKFGKIEFRAKLPSGVGPWSAAWMMGANISSVGWPTCGEIDVMEWRGTGGDSNTVGHAIHSASRFGANPVQPSVRSLVSNPSTQFHTYGVLWTSNSLVFSIDGVDKATLTPPSSDVEAFRKEFFILLNLAMGGSYVGSPIASGLTNATYEIDYVRVYQEEQVSPPPSDTTPPVISLVGFGTTNVLWGTTYLDAGASAFDVGDNSNVAVVTSGLVDTSVPGNYSISYIASDSKGNIATASRNVIVYMANGGANIGVDGLSDISRYAFGGISTNPLPKSLRPVTSTSTSTSTSQSGVTNHLVVTYYSRTNSNVTTIPVVSTDLGTTNWTTNGVLVNVLQFISTNNMLLEKRQAVTPMVGRQKFLRLKSELTQ